jgi:2-amino-4-hydroxy-6-hydroxymethyldihydropteridine diphosphokinase
MERGYLGIGSNLGNRLGYLQLAVDELARRSLIEVVAVSRVYETAPVGGPPQDAYLNAVVAIDTEMEAFELLHECQVIEERAERVHVERWGPRTLDVDVLLLDDRRVDSPDLTLPHPRMWERGFVLAPLRDVAPDLVEPGAHWNGVEDAGVPLTIPRPD